MKKLSLMIWVFWLMLTFSVSYADQVNIAPIYGLASADTYYSSDSLPGNAIDGDRETLWNAGSWATIGSPHWLVIDLQGEFSVNSIVVVGVENSLGFPWYFGYTNEYNLYTSTNGTSWTLVGSGTWAQDTDPDIYTDSYQLSGSPVRYIKYEVVGGSHWAAVHEIEIFADVGAVIDAVIDIDPDTLNLKSKGKWITCYIELPEGYDVADIDVSTIMLNGQVPAESRPTAIADYDSDGIADLMVKFSRSAVQGILGAQAEAELTVTGELTDGTAFEGKDTIRIITPKVTPKGKKK